MFWLLFAILNVLMTWRAMVLVQTSASFVFAVITVLIVIPTTLCLVGYALKLDVLPPELLRPFCWVVGGWSLFSASYVSMAIIQSVPADAGSGTYYIVGGFILLALLMPFLQWFGVWRYTEAHAL